MAAESTTISVLVCHSPAPRQVVERWHTLPAGTTVAQWLEGQGPDTAHAGEALAIWGKPARPEQLLRDQDRLEWLRPLTVDPKVARRERFKGQGAKTAGLFASRRPGAKPGY